MVVTEEDKQAKVRRDMGMTRASQVTRTSKPNPANGGSTGYDTWFREQQVAKFENGEDVDVGIASIYRWRERMLAFRATGNKTSSTLVGEDQLLMVFLLFAYPAAQEDEIAAFIYDSGGKIYERSQISKRLKELKMTKKKGSTEAYQAFTERNILKCRRFWSHPPPLGVVGIPRSRLIDVDECGFDISQTNRTSGHGHTTIRLRKPGHYSRDTKLTIIMAVEAGDPTIPPNVYGSTAHPRRWIRIDQDAGTSAVEFANFCDMVCSQIEGQPLPNNGDAHRYFIWDNLTSHKAPIVYQTIEGRIHGCSFECVPRPPYQPKYGPIEYVFCELACRLRDLAKEEWTYVTLRQEIFNVAAQLGMDGKFDNTFEHCGYTVDGVYNGQPQI
jgi:hypothetical protein